MSSNHSKIMAAMLSRIGSIILVFRVSEVINALKREKVHVATKYNLNSLERASFDISHFIFMKEDLSIAGNCKLQVGRKHSEHALLAQCSLCD